MRTKFFSLKFFSLMTALACSLVISAEANPQDPKPVVVFTLTSKVMTAKLKTAEIDGGSVSGRTTFTLTSANDDDTLTGILVYTLSDGAREKLAKLTNHELSEIPTNFVKKDVIATFRKGTACPIAHLEIPATELDSDEAAIRLDRVVLEINETRGQLSQLLCAWARQATKKSQHQGIIAAINRLIRGEEE